jgi:hypothetical protein
MHHDMLSDILLIADMEKIRENHQLIVDDVLASVVEEWTAGQLI